MFIIYFLCRLKMPCLCLTRQQIAIEVIEDRYIPANLTGLKIYLLQNMVILILKEMQNLLVTIATLPHIIYSYFVKPKIKFCCKNRWDIFIKHVFATDKLSANQILKLHSFLCLIDKTRQMKKKLKLISVRAGCTVPSFWWKIFWNNILKKS